MPANDKNPFIQYEVWTKKTKTNKTLSLCISRNLMVTRKETKSTIFAIVMGGFKDTVGRVIWIRWVVIETRKAIIINDNIIWLIVELIVTHLHLYLFFPISGGCLTFLR